MTLVIYNAALNAALANPNQNPVLTVAQRQLAPYAHSPQARGVLCLPEQDVEFVRERISPTQIGSHRPSYINAILIQSGDQAAPNLCIACSQPRPGLNPFPYCRHVVRHFGGACGNCKWRDHASRCSVRDAVMRPPPPPSSPPPPPPPLSPPLFILSTPFILTNPFIFIILVCFNSFIPFNPPKAYCTRGRLHQLTVHLKSPAANQAPI